MVVLRDIKIVARKAFNEVSKQTIVSFEKMERVSACY